MGLLDRFLRANVVSGDLHVTTQDGRTARYGDGSGPAVAVSITNAGARGIALKPTLGVGEAYMDGALTVSQGSLWDLLELFGRNGHQDPFRPVGAVKRLRRAWKLARQEANGRRAARANVSHHYDLSEAFYRLFLDADLQYSCAYFARPDMTLEAAQAAKLRHIAAKLDLAPGMRVLDIGCGWGGLALELAASFGVEVTGVTLSTEQLATAQRRAREAGLEDRARFELVDYRDVTGRFDRIVSVGMLEHVGSAHLGAYARDIRRLLADDGVALVHSIGRMEGRRALNAFARKHIFPGAYIPALSETVAAAERAGLWVTDVEVLRLHYAQTLRCWRERFLAHRAEAAALYDERFCRMWEYYLASAELGFRYAGHMNFQIQLTRSVHALPLVRDYMVDRERAPSQGDPAAT